MVIEISAEERALHPGVMDKLLDKILRRAYKLGASDIHMSTDKPAMFRVDGSLTPQKMPNIDAAAMERMMRSITPPEKYVEYVTTKELDFSCYIEGVSRFRVNGFFQMGKMALVFRIIPNKIPLMDDLHLPPVLQKILDKRQGLVLVTGPTGSGKSTTLASMINHMNINMNRHIITLEDPIEYVHESKQSLIDQREVGVDTLSFMNGLRASLRQDPDVILVGELRDLETISTAVSAAETGHLVFGTLHTNSAIATIERMIDMFPPEQHTQITVQIASTLQAVVAQQLIPLKEGRGRRAATEVLINTHAVKNQIASGKLTQIQSTLQTSRKDGMHTMDMDLRHLITKGIITEEAALPYMSKKE